MRVDARATLKTLRRPCAATQRTVVPELGFGRYEITVNGKAPYDFERVYVINSPNENLAAREGLDRFVAEFEGRTH